MVQTVEPLAEELGVTEGSSARNTYSTRQASLNKKTKGYMCVSMSSCANVPAMAPVVINYTLYTTFSQ